MRYFRVRAIAPEDGIEFLNWKTEAATSQDALTGFSQMLDEILDPPFQLKGDFNLEIREVEQWEVAA